jgi:hypothetical protein
VTRTSAPGAPSGATPGTPPSEAATAARSRVPADAPARLLARTLTAVTSVVVAGFLLLAGTGMLLAERGFSIVHQCVPAPDGWRALGVHLALLRESGCPAGTAALGGDPARVVTVVGVLALPVLLAHLALLLAGAGLAAMALRVRDRLIVVLGPRRLVALLCAPLLPSRAACDQVVRSEAAVLRHLALAAVRSLRGPPAVPAAA